MSDEFTPFVGPEEKGLNIDLGIIGEARAESAKQTEREMDILSDHPVAIIVGEKTYSLYPPTPGKVRLVLKMVKDLLGHFAEIGKTMQAEEAADSATLLDKVFMEGLDSFVDVARVLLEPNGRAIDLQKLAVSREDLEFSLTSKSFQQIIRSAFQMLDVPGLKKNLPASG